MNPTRQRACAAFLALVAVIATSQSTPTARTQLKPKPDPVSTPVLEEAPLFVPSNLPGPVEIVTDDAPSPVRRPARRSTPTAATLDVFHGVLLSAHETEWEPSNFLWFVLAPDMTFVPVNPDGDGSLVRFAYDELPISGRYAVMLVIVGASGQASQATGSFTIGEQPAPVTKGACCDQQGSCLVVTMADCVTLGGQYQGDGTSCTPNPCDGPPPPPPHDELWGFVIVETHDISGDHGVVLRDQELRRCFDAGKLRIIDKDNITNPAFREWIDQAKGKGLPYWFLATERGAILHEGPLPTDETEAVATATQHQP